VETIKTADYLRLRGYRPKSVTAGFGYGLGCTPAAIMALYERSNLTLPYNVANGYKVQDCDTDRIQCALKL